MVTTPENVGVTRVIIEDENQRTLRMLRYPEAASGLANEQWPVPLHNPYTGNVGDMGMYNGEVWIGQAGGKKGKIVFTGVPNVLESADDARRLAVALLAAADAKDEIDNPVFEPEEVKY